MQDIIEVIKPHSLKRFAKKRTILFYQGEVPRHAFIVVSGLIKVYSINPAGEERTVSLHAAGDLFPLPWIFGEASNTLFYYEALSDCELMTIDKTLLVETIEKKPALFRDVFQHVVNNYTGLLLRVTALEQSRAAEKIGFTLYYLLFHYGKERKPGIYDIDLNLTQPMIASLVGLTRETTAINLNLLKRKGIINYSSRRYSIDKSKLERFLGEDSFKDLVAG